PRRAAPPPRHPFPTRRSSDLLVGQHAAIVQADGHRIDVLEQRGLAEVRRQVVEDAPGRVRTVVAAIAEEDLGHGESPRAVESKRSEEHTSELQSPYDLVCRLL